MKKQIDKNKKNYKMWLVVPVFLFFLLVGSGLVKSGNLEEDSLLLQMQSKQGYIRTVGNEEYEFFKKLVDRDQPDDITEEELLNIIDNSFNISKLGQFSPLSHFVTVVDETSIFFANSFCVKFIIFLCLAINRPIFILSI